MSENNGDSYNIATDKAFRDVHGRFLPGSGGRPRGAKNKLPKHTMQRIEAMGDAALQQLWAAIHRSEWQAVEFVLRRILPADRAVELEGFTVDDLKDALINGDISSSEGKTLAAVLRDISEVESLDEIKRRLAELEEVVKSNE